MSPTRKRRQRKRLRDVDAVMSTLAEGMRQTQQNCRALDRALATWRTESEMPARDKYWVFSKKDRESGYRKGAHKVPKWTKYISNVFISLTFSKGFDERGAIWVLDSNAEGKKRSHGTH